MPDPKSRKGVSGPPPENPIPTPSYNPAGDYSYVETIADIHRTLGKLEQGFETLTKESTEVRKKVERLSHVVYAASLVVTIIGIILGIIANKVGDAIIAVMKAGH